MQVILLAICIFIIIGTVIMSKNGYNGDINEYIKDVQNRISLICIIILIISIIYLTDFQG